MIKVIVLFLFTEQTKKNKCAHEQLNFRSHYINLCQLNHPDYI